MEPTLGEGRPHVSQHSVREPLLPSNLDSSPEATLSGLKRKAAEPKKRAPKRKKQSEEEPTSPSSSNSEDEGLSQGEKKRKRQERLVKNREAAQLFRQRQKTYIQDLEKKVDALVSENQQFTSKTELLLSENNLLRDQLTYLRGFMSSVMSMASPLTGKMPLDLPVSSNPHSTLLPSLSPFSFASPADGGSERFNFSTPAPSPRPSYQGNPAASVAAAFQAAMGMPLQHTGSVRPENSAL